MQNTKAAMSRTAQKKLPSQLIEDQLLGNTMQDLHKDPEIIQFLNLADYSIYPNTEIPLETPLFTPEPTVIQFTNYEPLDTKQQLLRLRNKDNVSRRVKILPPESRLFTIYRASGGKPADTGTKVAPGMCIEFTVQFTPEAKIDYSYDLIVVTEREKFVIPVRCLGSRAMLSFPDEIHFGQCPVKYPTSKPVMIRNVGEKASKWVLQCPEPFSLDRYEGFLEVGQMDQITITFTPQESHVYETELILNYDSLEASILVVGEAQNDSNVYLSKTDIHIADTYITLESQASLKIINKSEVPIEFEWRAFADIREEQEKKSMLYQQLAQEEAEEKMMIEDNIMEDSSGESLDSDDSYDELELKHLRDRKLQRSLAALERKYTNIRQAVEDDLMLFQDEIFQIEPAKGKIWPNSSLDIIVTFSPQNALHYQCTAFCNVTCSEERLPLTLTAIGIGPKAELSVTEYDIGDVFVNNVHPINHIFLENKGAIEARYTIIPSDTPFGSKFLFEQMEGVLGTTEMTKQQQMKIKFCSELMGEFSETFKIDLHGSSDELKLSFKGHVMPPSFEFDRTEINYKQVSYQFPYTETIKLINTSEVSFNYFIRVPGDSGGHKKEFTITPERGLLSKGETHTIDVEFIPMTPKKYDLVLVVDIDGVGPDMHTLPIKAECFVPKVDIIPSDVIDFGNSFLRNKYYSMIELANKSQLNAKYEIITQDEQSTLFGIFKPDKQEGFIDKHQSTFIEIELIPQKAGDLRIPMYIKILGDNSQPHMITLLTKCTGPIVRVLTPDIDFGRVEVLRPYTQNVKIHNQSDIEAEYTVFTKKKGSVFRIPDKKGKLQPDEKRDIQVVCQADECIPFTEILFISVKEGEDRQVNLKARGKGNTAYTEEDIRIIDFGTIYTNRNITKRYFIENRGQKSQLLRWNRYNARGTLIPITISDQKSRGGASIDRSRASASASRDQRNQQQAEEFIFNVTPIVFQLPKKTGVWFEFSAQSTKFGEHSEKLVCTSRVGNEDKDKTIYECTLQGNFIDPFLQFSENILHFKYIWEKDIEIEPMYKDVQVQCVSLLPINCLLKVAPPFSINKERLNMETGDTDVLRIEFDPGHKYDKISGQSVQKLTVIHKDHPHRDSIDLVGEVCYPNLLLQTSEIDFGCILNDTSKKIYMKITNNSILETRYQWHFVQEVHVDDQNQVSEEDLESTNPSQFAFDILPILGTLQPGESEQVEFIFNAQTDQHYEILAICAVEGGPEYEVRLKGESSLVQYQLSKYSLDFGEIAFNESSPQDFFIENTGKVPFEFMVNLEQLTKPGIIDVIPAYSKIAAGEKCKVVVKVTPGVPDSLDEVILVEISYYEPIMFRVKAQGVYPSMHLNLPRPDEDTNYKLKFEKLKAQYSQEKSVDVSTILDMSDSRVNRVSKIDPILLEIETEVDRQIVNEEIQKGIDEYYIRASKRNPKGEVRSLINVLEDIQKRVIAANWVCNLGNMVLGNLKAKQIRITNTGKSPLSLSFDIKQLKFNGITLEPAKITKLPPDGSQLISVKFQSNKKTMSFGNFTQSTTIQVAGGLTYMIYFTAMLTTPDFELSSKAIDFEYVPINCISKAIVRLENTREVPCEWKYVPKQNMNEAPNAPKDHERFQIIPDEGTIQPYKIQTIEVIFTPTHEKLINQKLEFKIQDNQAKKYLAVRGQGVNKQIELIPKQVTLGPVLPYKKTAYQVVEMKNPTQYQIEVYSLNFDQQYKEEEEMLKQYDQFVILAEEGKANRSARSAQNTVTRKEYQPLFLDPRKPGQPIWREVQSQYQQKQKRIAREIKDREMREKLKSEDQEVVQEAEEYFKFQAENPEPEEIEIKLPGFIPFENRLNYVVWGKPGHGKSILAQSLAQNHNRQYLSMESVVEWHAANQTALNQTIQQILVEQELRKQQDLQEREKTRKRRKPEEDIFDEKVYRYLPNDILKQAIEQRLDEPDCNAGIVFDDLTSEYNGDAAQFAKILSDIIGIQNLYLVLLDDIETEQPQRVDYDEILEVDEIVDEGLPDEILYKEIVEADFNNFVLIKQDVIDVFVEKEVVEEEDKKEEIEEEEKEEEEEQPVEETPKGERGCFQVPCNNSRSVIVKFALQYVKEPVFPHPDSLPLPPPKIYQIVNRPRVRQQLKVFNEFKIFTLINQTPINQREEEKSEHEEQTQNEEEEKIYVQREAEYNLEENNLDGNKTRWIIPPHNSQFILVKFFSEEKGNYENTLQFEIVGNPKTYKLNCKSTCAFPVINIDPRNLFMHRRRTRPNNIPEKFVNRHYIQTEHVFEFGPLLMGKNYENRHDENCRNFNMTNFRITNNGLYDLEISFAFKSQAKEQKSVFFIEPDTMQLMKEETKVLQVWALPDQIGQFQDTLIGLIKNNPKPLLVPLQCEGELPKADIDPEIIQFERILLKQKLVKTFTITSKSKIPISWNLRGAKELPQEFSLDQTEGILKPYQNTIVQVTFEAIKQQKFNEKIFLDIFDVENLGVKQEPKTITLEAEAFDITVDINYGNDQGLIDFKNVRVFDEATQTLSLKNHGQYEVDYKFILLKKSVRELFSFTPIDGTLNPNQEQAIQVVFCTKQGLNIKTTRQTSEIRLQILEGRTKEKFEEIPINVSVNAVFSTFSLYPLKNINFGPLQYGESKTRSFELRNDGIFEFDFNITELVDQRLKNLERMQSKLPPPVEEEKKKAPPKKQEAKKAPPQKGRGAQQSSVEIGPFIISPNTGSVAPQSSAQIEVAFHADGARAFEKQLAIDVSRRDPVQHPSGVPYLILGESCIPGINTWDLDAIFEEQTVVPSLAIAHAQEVLSAKVFAQEENVFLFGTLVASQGQKDCVERFKIINCTKIAAKVNFSVKPRTASKSEGFAFERYPESALIQPHSFEYVSVVFKPVNMMSYGGVFEAIVEHGEQNPKTHKISFEIRGEGTLPTLAQLNSQISDDGKSIVRFGKTRVGKTAQAEISFINQGLVPATAIFDVPYHKNFEFMDALNITIQPKTSMKFVVHFKPDQTGSFTHTIQMNTLHNPYENIKLYLDGTGYQEDLMYEKLPEDQEDVCKIGECVVGKSKQVSFVIRSHCDAPLKYMWPQRPHFVFEPQMGHLKPFAKQTVTVTFNADEVVNYQNLDLGIQIQRIEQTGDEFIDWNSSMCTIKYVTPKQYARIVKRREEAEELRRQEEEAKKKRGGKQAPKKQEVKQQEPSDLEDDDEEPTVEITEMIPEPQFNEVDKQAKPIPLKFIAVADYTKYSCQIKDINFAPTLMFGTRTYKFALRNESTTQMKFLFKICSGETGRLDAGPYSLAPREGTVAPGCDVQVTVKFAPIEVDEENLRLLVCSLRDLAPDLEPLVIEMKGKSLRPVCHFELQPSQYREKKAQEMAPIDSSYQIVEFESLGTQVKNTKRFYVVNPTSNGYKFRWEIDDREGSQLAQKQFKCLTPKGVVLSGKKFEMVFEYTPEITGTHESFWKFVIPGEKIVQNFLIVGTVMEPLILMEIGKINFGQLLIDGKAKETVRLVNQEHIPFSFSFDKNSIRGDESYSDSLSVQPISGTVPANGKFNVDVMFRPRKEIEYNYNLVCNVKRKQRPIVLNVKGVGYTIRHSVFYENSHNELLPSEPNQVNFGQIFVNEQQIRTVSVVNSGKFNFDFAWKKPPNCKSIQISPEQGTVKTQDKVDISLIYHPTSDGKFENMKLQLGIVSGPIYNFLCSASARKPGVQFSFLEKDFGPCFVFKTIMPREAILELVNYDTAAVSIESDFQKLPHLDVQLAPGQVLLPTTKDDPELESKKLKIPIIFTPRDLIQYQETITFDINNIHKVNVNVKGEGCPIRLELGSPEQELVDFGIVKLGGQKSRTVQLANRSKRAIQLQLVDGSGVEEFKKLNITFTPDNELMIKPREVVPIELTFKPENRLHPFTNELNIQFTNGEIKKLLLVKGACHGMEVKFMEEVVSFGTVVQGSHQAKSLHLVNIGDLPCIYNWEDGPYEQFFSIHPKRGTVAPSTDTNFEIIFHPRIAQESIRFEGVKCHIKGSDPLTLTLLGHSIGTPNESFKELNFDTVVRETQTLKVQIQNKTQTKWRVLPSFSNTGGSANMYWSGMPAIEVPPGNADYEITYHPITMTHDEPHRGTLFFPLPDGSALVYNLTGVSKPPKPADTIVQEVKAKIAQIVTLPVRNWLMEIQRFSVSWEIEGTHDPGVIIRGANTIDVPPGSIKDYKLNFVSYKQGVTKFTVRFINLASKEYLFYNIEMKATSQDSQGSVELVCPVRETASGMVMVQNPLDTKVEIEGNMLHCDNDYVQIVTPYLTVPAKSESAIELLYRPLVVGEASARLAVRTQELGEFIYNLVLKGLPTSSQRQINFKTAIGTELVQVFRFQHYLKKQIQYQIRIERIGQPGHSDFSVDKPTCDAQAAQTFEGVEITLPIRYEPSNLGESRSMLVLTHPEGGEFTCVLQGSSSPPMPQGPYRCPVGKSINAEFKNPFFEPVEFSIRFDSPSFTSGTKSPLRIDAKKGVAISVTYKPVAGYEGTGRLIISAGDLPPWIYYLQGE